MKAVVAVLVFALLALADARTVLKNKSTATATSTATAEEGSVAYSDAHALAKNGSDATAVATSTADDDSIALSSADATAIDGSSALATADATADDDSIAYADATAFADYWSTAIADADAVADNDGYAKAEATAKAFNEAEADSGAVATADGGEASANSFAKADGGSAESTAKAEAEEAKKLFYKPKYYYVDPTKDDDDDDKDGFLPYFYNPDYLYPFGRGFVDPKAGDADDKDDRFFYPFHGYYIPKVEEAAEEEDVTVVKFVDPALLKYYAHKVYDFGCFEGKFYRCTYDDSCGKCPFGHFCGETSKTVCKAVKVWVKKCDPKTAEPVKKCKPVLSPCGKGFCKYNEKCATDYFWCGGRWCEPKYTCVAVAAPKKCTFVIVKDDYGFEKKMEKCVDFTEEACAAGKAPCPIGYECSADPCTFVEETRKVCGEEKVPVCMPFDIPTFKDLFKPCGPGFCHPGYKCESFKHKTCEPEVDPTKVIVIPVHHYVDDVKPVNPIVHLYDDDDDNDDGDTAGDNHYFIPITDPKSDSKATATSTSTSTAKDGVSYTNVEVHATGDGSASGSADASTDNSSAWSKGTANKDVEAKIWTGSKAVDGGKGVATGTATYEDDD